MNKNPIYRPAEIFSYEAMREKLLAIPNDRERLFFLCTYANGLRISEALDLKMRNIEAGEEFLFIRSVVLKKRFQHFPIRNLPIPYALEGWLTQTIKDLSLKLRDGPDDKNKVWQMSKRTAQYRADEYFGTTAHALRHNRVTHLITEFGFSMLDLKEAFCLSEAGLTRWVGTYGHLQSSHLENKWRSMINNVD